MATALGHPRCLIRGPGILVSFVVVAVAGRCDVSVIPVERQGQVPMASKPAITGPSSSSTVVLVSVDAVGRV